MASQSWPTIYRTVDTNYSKQLGTACSLDAPTVHPFSLFLRQTAARVRIERQTNGRINRKPSGPTNRRTIARGQPKRRAAMNVISTQGQQRDTFIA